MKNNLVLVASLLAAPAFAAGEHACSLLDGAQTANVPYLQICVNSQTAVLFHKQSQADAQAKVVAPKSYFLVQANDKQVELVGIDPKRVNMIPAGLANMISADKGALLINSALLTVTYTAPKAVSGPNAADPIVKSLLPFGTKVSIKVGHATFSASNFIPKQIFPKL